MRTHFVYVSCSRKCWWQTLTLIFRECLLHSSRVVLESSVVLSICPVLLQSLSFKGLWRGNFPSFKSIIYPFEETRKMPLLRVLTLHTIFLFLRDGWDVCKTILLIRSRTVKEVSLWNDPLHLGVCSFFRDLFYCLSWWIQFSLKIFHCIIMTLPIQ